jgi:hypothetical protein
MEQNCRAFFESSIWHLTKAHDVTQKSIACAGNTVMSHTFSYVTNCNRNEFYADYICNMLKTPHTHTHTHTHTLTLNMTYWTMLKLIIWYLLFLTGPVLFHNPTNVYALNLRKKEYHIDSKAKCCNQRFVYIV